MRVNYELSQSAMNILPRKNSDFDVSSARDSVAQLFALDRTKWYFPFRNTRYVNLDIFMTVLAAVSRITFLPIPYDRV